LGVTKDSNSLQASLKCSLPPVRRRRGTSFGAPPRWRTIIHALGVPLRPPRFRRSRRTMGRTYRNPGGDVVPSCLATTRPRETAERDSGTLGRAPFTRGSGSGQGTPYEGPELAVVSPSLPRPSCLRGASQGRFLGSGRAGCRFNERVLERAEDAKHAAADGRNFLGRSSRGIWTSSSGLARRTQAGDRHLGSPPSASGDSPSSVWSDL